MWSWEEIQSRKHSNPGCPKEARLDQSGLSQRGQTRPIRAVPKRPDGRQKCHVWRKQGTTGRKRHPGYRRGKAISQQITNIFQMKSWSRVLRTGQWLPFNRTITLRKPRQYWSGLGTTLNVFEPEPRLEPKQTSLERSDNVHRRSPTGQGFEMTCRDQWPISKSKSVKEAKKIEAIKRLKHVLITPRLKGMNIYVNVTFKFFFFFTVCKVHKIHKSGFYFVIMVHGV